MDFIRNGIIPTLNTNADHIENRCGKCDLNYNGQNLQKTEKSQMKNFPPIDDNIPQETSREQLSSTMPTRAPLLS